MAANNLYFPQLKRVYEIDTYSYIAIDDKKTGLPNKITFKELLISATELGIINKNLGNSNQFISDESRIVKLYSTDASHLDFQTKTGASIMRLDNSRTLTLNLNNLYINGVAGFTGTGNYNNFVVEKGIITDSTYVNNIPAPQNLTNVLSVGNETLGYDINLTDGDNIHMDAFGSRVGIYWDLGQGVHASIDYYDDDYMKLTSPQGFELLSTEGMARFEYSRDLRLVSYTNINPKLTLYADNDAGLGHLTKQTLTGTRTWTLPDDTGIIALTSDIPALQDLQSVVDTGSNATIANGLFNLQLNNGPGPSIQLYLEPEDGMQLLQSYGGVNADYGLTTGVGRTYLKGGLAELELRNGSFVLQSSILPSGGGSGSLTVDTTGASLYYYDVLSSTDSRMNLDEGFSFTTTIPDGLGSKTKDVTLKAEDGMGVTTAEIATYIADSTDRTFVPKKYIDDAILTDSFYKSDGNIVGERTVTGDFNNLIFTDFERITLNADLILGTTTVTNLGFWGTTPTSRPSAVTSAQGLTDALVSIGLIASSTITQIYGGQVVDSASSIPNLNWALGNVFEYTLDEDLSINFSNTQDGQTITVAFKQNNIGGWNLTLPSSIKWGDAYVPTMSQLANSTDVYTFVKVNGIIYGTVIKNMS